MQVHRYPELRGLKQWHQGEQEKDAEKSEGVGVDLKPGGPEPMNDDEEEYEDDERRPCPQGGLRLVLVAKASIQPAE